MLIIIFTPTLLCDFCVILVHFLVLYLCIFVANYSPLAICAVLLRLNLLHVYVFILFVVICSLCLKRHFLRRTRTFLGISLTDLDMQKYWVALFPRNLCNTPRFLLPDHLRGKDFPSLHLPK